MKHSFVLFLSLLVVSLSAFHARIAFAAVGEGAAAAAGSPTTAGGAPVTANEGGAPAGGAGTAGLAGAEAAQGEGKSALAEAEALQEAEASKTQLVKGTKECDAAVDAAKNACVESLSPFLQMAMQGLTAAMAAQQGAAGASGQCQQAQQAQQPAQQNMQKFNADCGTKKTACEQKCGQASTGADTVTSTTCEADAKKAGPAKQQMISAQCKKAAASNKKANEKGKAACAAFSQNQAAGMAGIGELLKGLMKSGQCQQQVAVDCTKTPTAQGCPQALDCNKPENAANPRCICEKNPRAPGCGGQAESAPITDPTRDDTQSTAGANDGALGSPTDATPAQYGSDSADAKAGLPASPGGGGGGGGLGKGGDSAEKGEKPKTVDTNVLAEGGGGGGASATSNGLTPSEEGGGKYSKYLPEDPARKPTALADQVSGAAGLSNWEKIRKRYSENRPSLLRP